MSVKTSDDNDELWEDSSSVEDSITQSDNDDQKRNGLGSDPSFVDSDSLKKRITSLFFSVAANHAGEGDTTSPPFQQWLSLANSEKESECAVSDRSRKGGESDRSISKFEEESDGDGETTLPNLKACCTFENCEKACCTFENSEKDIAGQGSDGTSKGDDSDRSSFKSGHGDNTIASILQDDSDEEFFPVQESVDENGESKEEEGEEEGIDSEGGWKRRR